MNNPFKKRTVWLVFDLDNLLEYNGCGQRDFRGYVWYFETRAKARAHNAWQKKQKYAARLSQPIKFYR